MQVDCHIQAKYSSVADSKQSSNDCIAKCIESHSIVALSKLPIEGILPIRNLWWKGLAVARVHMYLYTLIQVLRLVANTVGGSRFDIYYFKIQIKSPLHHTSSPISLILYLSV